MITHYTSAVELLERASEKFGESIAFKDTNGEISFGDLREKSRLVAQGLLNSVKCG